MGRITVTIEVGDPQEQRFQEVEVIVDTGATLSAIPADILRELGIQVRRTENARLANGTRMPVEIGGATIKVEGDNYQHRRHLRPARQPQPAGSRSVGNSRPGCGLQNEKTDPPGWAGYAELRRVRASRCKPNVPLSRK